MFLATVISFILANQIRVAYGGEFVAGVIYFRYFAYFLIGLFFLGVKLKVIVRYNLAMIALICILLEIFFLIVTPLGIISRLLSPKEQLQLKNDKPYLFVETNKKFDKAFFEKPW